jgi:hypothetical protein
MVRALCDSNEEITDMTRFGIQRWLARFNRSFLSPTHQQLEELVDAIQQCGGLLDEKTQEQLRFSIRGFS